MRHHSKSDAQTCRRTMVLGREMQRLLSVQLAKAQAITILLQEHLNPGRVRTILKGSEGCTGKQQSDKLHDDTVCTGITEPMDVTCLLDFAQGATDVQKHESACTLC